MSNGDLGAGLCLVLHLTKSDTEVSIPLNPVLPCVMGKWDCCIANWCSLVNCRKETEETDIRRVTQPKLKHIQIGKCRAPDPQSWLLLKLWQRLRNGAGITILGTGTRRWGLETETVSVQREYVPLGCVKSSSTAWQPPLVGYLMKVFAAIATVAPGTSTDRLGKDCSGAGETHHAGLRQYREEGRRWGAGRLRGEVKAKPNRV